MIGRDIFTLQICASVQAPYIIFITVETDRVPSPVHRLGPGLRPTSADAVRGVGGAGRGQLAGGLLPHGFLRQQESRAVDAQPQGRQEEEGQRQGGVQGLVQGVHNVRVDQGAKLIIIACGTILMDIGAVAVHQLARPFTARC